VKGSYALDCTHTRFHRRTFQKDLTMNADQLNAAGASVIDDSLQAAIPSLRSLGINEIVIVDAAYDRYADFVQAARAGEVGVHFCSDGRSALRLARRFRSDIWLVSTDLADMSGFDLLEMLSTHVVHGDVDPMLSGARISLGRLEEAPHSAIFMVAEEYRLEDEQRALVSGIAGYLVRPITLDVIRATREAAVASSVDG
jgi:DNA-binding response OmpR family regulator